MGLSFLLAKPIIRVYIVQGSLMSPLMKLVQSPLQDCQRTVAAVFKSFSLSEENKLKLVHYGGMTQILR
ncbi:hypothetical protein BBJ28_00007327 [Nothophytophthora sp. Chile5]|nr:hypothetical protein BBJ28_00007327 [Nothophytophthora sp. Chile5]